MAEQSVPDDLESLARAFGVPDVDVSDGVVEFECEAGLVIANVLEHSARVRVRLYLEFDDEAVVEKWVLAQPDLRSGLIEASELEGQTQPRLVFERPIGHDWANDQLVAEALLYRDAWRSGTRVNASDLPQTFRVADDPLDIRPESALSRPGVPGDLLV